MQGTATPIMPSTGGRVRRFCCGNSALWVHAEKGRPKRTVLRLFPTRLCGSGVIVSVCDEGRAQALPQGTPPEAGVPILSFNNAHLPPDGGRCAFVKIRLCDRSGLSGS